MTGQVFQGHKISEGVAEAEILISEDDMCFYLVDPKDGVVIEPGHSLYGQSIANKILVFPTGKGSSVVQADGMYQLLMKGTSPKAMIISHPDTVLVASAIIVGIPMVDRMPEEFYDKVENGVTAHVDADKGVVSLSNVKDMPAGAIAAASATAAE